MSNNWIFPSICTSFYFSYTQNMADVPKNFLISPRKRFIRGFCIILGILFLIVWFWNRLNTWEQNTLWIIDNSLSMAVTDIHSQTWITISRLDLAKQLIAFESNYMIGNQAIMTAANGARLELPMTQDQQIFSDVLNGIQILTRWWGSSLATPLETIRLIYGSTPNLHIIWLTDGEFSDSGSTLSGFSTSPSITFVGIGTPLGWPILEWYNTEWLPRYKESQGVQVISIRDDKKLKNISKILDAKLIQRDTSSQWVWNLIQGKNIEPSKNISFSLIFWFLLLIIGFLFPRYQYLSKKISWK